MVGQSYLIRFGSKSVCVTTISTEEDLTECPILENLLVSFLFTNNTAIRQKLHEKETLKNVK